MKLLGHLPNFTFLGEVFIIHLSQTFIGQIRIIEIMKGYISKYRKFHNLLRVGGGARECTNL